MKANQEVANQSLTFLSILCILTLALVRVLLKYVFSHYHSENDLLVISEDYSGLLGGS